MTLAISTAFNSFEAFNAFPHGWDADFRVTTTENYRATLQHAAAEGILLNSASYSQPTLQRASTPVGMYTMALPVYVKGPMTWYHHEIDQRSLMLFAENRELFSVSSAAMHITTLSIHEELFESQLEQIDLADVQALRDGRVSQVSDEQWQHLHHCLETLTDFCRQNQNDATNPDLEHYLMEETTYQLVRAALDNSEGGYRLPLHAAAKHARRAMNYIIPRLNTPLTVAEVCSMTGIGRRNLELSFKRYLGLSPKQFIKQTRFALCREDLSSAHANSVGEVAQAWGFWHMGQFGRDYKNLFGEVPSATLKRATKR